MLLLIFKLFSWRIACQALLILILIQVISLLLLSLILLTVVYLCRCLILQKQIKSLVKYQENYCEKTAILMELAKLTIFSVNKLKNPLTSLRIILDELKDPAFLNKKQKVKKYISKADELLVRIKHKDEILCKQIIPQETESLFDLKKEIEKILKFYEEVFKQHGIVVNFNSDREYRIYAQQDQLLRIINSVLLTSVQSLISSKKKDKHLKIYLIKTAYLLKIVIEVNAGINNSKSINGLIRINCFEKSKIDEFQLSLYFANKMMKKYFHKKIEIFNEKNVNTKLCLKIKNSYILAEPKVKC